MLSLDRPRSLFGVTALLLVVHLFAPARAQGAEFFVEMFSGAFLPQNVTVQAGDTVTWVHVAGSHVVTSGTPGGTPGTIDEPGALFQGPVDAQNPTFSYTPLSWDNHNSWGINLSRSQKPHSLDFGPVKINVQTGRFSINCTMC